MKDSMIASFLTEHGKEVMPSENGLVATYCPSCGPSQNGEPKLLIKINQTLGKEQWECSCCNKRGDAVDMLVSLRGISVSESIKEIRKVFGANISFNRSVDTDVQAALEQVISILLEKAPTYERDCINYLSRGRCLPPSILQRASIRGLFRFLPGGKDWKVNMKWLEENVGEELLRHSGLWREGAKVPGIAYRPLLSFFPKGKSLEMRSLTPKPGMPETLRYGLGVSPYWWPSNVNATSKTSTEVWVSNGYIEMLTIGILFPHVNVVGLTSSSWKPDWIGSLKMHYGNLKLTSALQGDESGNKTSLRLQEFCTGAEIPFKREMPITNSWNQDFVSSKIAI